MTENLESILHTEVMDLDKLNESMRRDGLPIMSTSVDATAGASVTNYMELQKAEASAIASLTPAQLQQRIRDYKFQVWSKTVQMMEVVRHLESLKANLTKEQRKKQGLDDAIAFNPKELANPQKLSSGSRLTNEEKQAADLQKALPHMTIADCLEMIRKGRGAAFQKGLATGAGSPVAMDDCPDCKASYPASSQHDCPVKAEKKQSLSEKLASLRSAQAAQKSSGENQ